MGWPHGPEEMLTFSSDPDGRVLYCQRERSFIPNFLENLQRKLIFLNQASAGVFATVEKEPPRRTAQLPT